MKDERQKLKVKNRGVTLLELLVVMVIIGILAGISLSAIDRVRERNLFDQTQEELKVLAQAVTGNPELVVDGKRIDFGYVGDLGKLPDSLGSLVTNEGGLWRGPYIRLRFVEDRESYKIDAWGKYYQYSPEDLVIRSFGTGRISLTYRFAERIEDLFGNKVFGYVYDRENNPPGKLAPKIRLKIFYPKDGERVSSETVPRSDGYFVFHNIPIGNHRVRLSTAKETLEKFITVTPRSEVMLEFKLPTVFRGKLIYVSGSCYAFPADTFHSFSFKLFNPTEETVAVTSLALENVPQTLAFYEAIRVDNTQVWNYGGGKRAKIGQEILFDPSITIKFPPAEMREFMLLRFMDDSLAVAPNPVDMRGKEAYIRTSDGSLNKIPIP